MRNTLAKSSRRSIGKIDLKLDCLTSHSISLRCRTYPTAAWVGIYELFNKPAIVVRDLELVKEILVGSFQHFNRNSFEVDETIDPLVAINPFTQSGDLWKERRSQVVPVFSQTKIRSCFPIIKNVADNFLEYVTKTRKTSPDFEAKDVRPS